MRAGAELRHSDNLCSLPFATGTPPRHREWADFDEKLGESVSIMGIESTFKTHKR